MYFCFLDGKMHAVLAVDEGYCKNLPKQTGSRPCRHFSLGHFVCHLWSRVCAPFYLDYRKFDGIYKKMASLLKFFPEKRKRKECFIRTPEVGSVFRV